MLTSSKHNNHCVNQNQERTADTKVLVFCDHTCYHKLHHAAFDSFILSVSPDYIVQVRADVLVEEDGPLLRHGLQGLHNTRLVLPARCENHPSREALAWRYEQFREAG